MRRAQDPAGESRLTYSGGMDMPDVTGVARGTRITKAVRFLARVGYAMNGVVNVIIGIIAIGIAVSAGGGGSADQSGAFGAIAATPGGLVLLWFISIALAALGLWYLLGSFATRGGDKKKKAADIAVTAGKGVAYLALAFAAFGFVLGAGADSSNQASSTTAQLMATPGGVILVVLVGLLFGGIGVYMVRKGVTRGFEEDITVPSGRAGKGVKALGVFGYVARGIALFIVGALFVAAAITFDPSKATGLDGALKTLADLPFGKVILVIVGLGFVAYGAYSFLRARLARLE